MKKDDKNYWRSMIPVFVMVFGLMVWVGSAAAACVIQDSSGRPVQNNNDPLAKFLSAADACPKNVFEFRSQLTSAGAKLRPALVANGGFHNPKTNPKQVQMMLFETSPDISTSQTLRSTTASFSSAISSRQTGQTCKLARLSSSS